MIKMAISTCLSIITSTINEQNALIKRQREADWIEKTRTYNILPTRDSLQGESHAHKQKVRGTGQESIATLKKTKQPLQQRP